MHDELTDAVHKMDEQRTKVKASAFDGRSILILQTSTGECTSPQNLLKHFATSALRNPINTMHMVQLVHFEYFSLI